MSALAAKGETSRSGFKQNNECSYMGIYEAYIKLSCYLLQKHNWSIAFKEYLPLHYKSQNSSLTDKDIFLDWFISVFVPSVEQNIKKLGRPQKPKCIRLLILVEKTKLYIFWVWSEVKYTDQVYETSIGFMLIIHKELQRSEISF